MGRLTGPMICDTHMHFYDGRFPTSPDAVVLADDALPDDYAAVRDELGVERIVVVQPSAYGLDNRAQLQHMAPFGDAARGVMVVDATTPPDELRRLTELGVRGARFHMLPGGAVGWDHLEPVAAAIAPFGWHIQLQLNGRELSTVHERLARLPTEVVVDHVGRFMPPVDVDHPSFRALLALVEHGRAWVKLSAPYESSIHDADDNVQAIDVVHPDVDVLVDALVDQVPERLVWATNWPHPGRSDPPTAGQLVAQRNRWLPDAELRRRVLEDNPDELYFR